MSARGFSLMEVLVATALFGMAVVGLFMALHPVRDSLVNLSERSDDAGVLEILRSVVNASPDRAALSVGGDVPLPTGKTVRWRASLENTADEALYRVTLTGERDGMPLVRASYLRFEPKWAEASEGAPQWLAHSTETPTGGTAPDAAPGGGRVPKPGPGQGADGSSSTVRSSGAQSRDRRRP